MPAKDSISNGILTPKLKEVIDAIPTEGISSSKLKEKLGISKNALYGRLRRIEKIQPEIAQKVVGSEEPSFSNLEDKLENDHNAVIAKNLYMGEMGFGTKAYDPEAMSGLKYFLQYNNRTDINNVMMLGGLVPRVPEYYSVSGSEDMRFLGKDPTKEPSEEIEMMVKRAKLKPTDAKYFKEHVDGKIKTRQDAVNAARTEIEKIAEVLTQAEWHYQHGEEDRENIKVTKEILIADASKKKQNLEQYNAEIVELENRLEEMHEQRARLGSANKFMDSVIKGMKKAGKDGLQSYLANVVETELPEYNVEPSLVKLLSSKNVTKDKLIDEIGKLRESYSKIGRQENEIENQIKDYHRKIDAVKRQQEAWGFFRATKRGKVESDEEEVFFRIAKSDYNRLLYGVFPDLISNRAHIHSSAFNELVDPLSSEEGRSTASIVGDEEEYSVIKENDGLVYLLAHNPNMLNSNAATGKDLRNMKDEVQKLVKLYDVLGIPIPDVTLSSHGKGGFRYQPQMKYRETIIEGQNRLIPETVMHIKLPTLQSVPKLEQLRRRGVRNVHTKRYNSGKYATGVVFHTMYENGKFDIEYIDESTLRKFAEIGKQIEEKKGQLAKSQDSGLENEIHELEQKLKIGSDLTKLEADGDSHLGSANESGRRSNYQIVDAVQKYHHEYGLPNVLVISEAIHAAIQHVCDTDKQTLGLNPKKFEMLLEDIGNSGISDADKWRRTKQVSIEQVHSTPITNIDYTLTEWKDRCLPYVLDVLDKGGRVIIVSGNHYNKSGSGRDEAMALANMIPEQYKDRVETFHARGDTIGCGETILPGGKMLYATHKLRDGMDEFINAFDQVLRQGITADLVMHFDRHHGGGGFSDNTAFTMAPGRQTWSKYVDQISKLSSPAGVVDTYLTQDKDIKYIRWEWALSDCLENYFMEPIDREVSLHQRRSYIPRDPEKLKK